MRSTWTDSRLDDLKLGVDSRLDDLSSRVSNLDTRLTSRIDALQHTIMIVGGGLFAAFVSLLAAMIGLIVTQL